MRPTARLLISAASVLAATVSCKGTEPGTPAPIPLYKNGFLYSWAATPLLVSNGNGVVINKTATATNDVNGDGTVMSATMTSGSPCISVGCLIIIEPTASVHQSVPKYYPSGHLQFDVKLGVGHQFTSFTMVGLACMASASDACASQQSGTVVLDPANYNTSTFTHVSIPIASLYPPSSISTTVPVPFEIKLFGYGVFYIDDVKWTAD